MKRMLIAFASVAGLGLVAGSVAADPGGFAPPGGGAPVVPQYGSSDTFLGAGGVPPGRGPDQYGWNPLFKKFFRGLPGHGCNSCGGCYDPGSPHYKNPLMNPANWSAGGYGQGGPAYNPQGFPPGAYGPNGPMMQGTLVFPHQPFIRSPRDFFMVDVNK
jgi:hypothetical protein